MEDETRAGGKNGAPRGHQPSGELTTMWCALAEMKAELDELRSQLDTAVSMLRRAMEEAASSRTTGELFASAGEFIESQRVESEERAARVVSEARQIAEGIIRDASARAMEVADRTSTFLFIPPDVLERLERSISDFSDANNEVSGQLGSSAGNN